MWKISLSLAFLYLVAGQATFNEVSNHTTVELVSNNSSLSANLTTESKKTTGHKVDEIVINRDADEGLGSEHNPFEPANLATMPDDGSIGNFKYYFILLAFSSLSVIAIIVFKAFRLRKSRAEIKYGKASTSDRSEVEPLGKSKWLEESSDENEDEVFDINFLKNSRSQN